MKDAISARCGADLAPTPVHVIGAAGRSGTALCRALLARGTPYVPVIRRRSRWEATGLPGTPLSVDLTAPASVGAALAGARRVVSCAHARFAPAILDAAPPGAHFVFLGSTRKFTRWPDAHGNGVLEGEAAFLASGRPGVMLHPTMIYGAAGEDNVQRLARLLRRLPVVPLPGGGRNLVQPIEQGDVTRAILAALDREWTGPESLVIAGPAPVPYRQFILAIARAAGLPRPRLMPLPLIVLRLVTPFTTLPGVPRVRGAELRRLLEDKAFDISPMRDRLGIEPIPLEQGLAVLFGTA